MGRPVEIPFHELVRTHWSTARTPFAEAVKDPESWAVLWRNVSGNHIPPPEPPAVDWASSMVLFVAIGTRNSGGYTVEITRLIREDDVVRVEARETRPGPRDVVTCAITEPFHAVTLPRQPDGVRFDLRLDVVVHRPRV
ncbi:protease complex subunit PrcB family protein [Streptomyces cylindrosporus]|uniref:Protease complex subunit PrcB family protein n=1 Tax=Streptomyces cylindrosporus TaxID=2927583 RepID=A0ABS9YQ61_9ACTN|nr:protease complex subunit PrcB family protein [Streptomyces cylindrosporus]MCI3277996.1 protease complex subunit PrcB family protein [Streptomyces cylindrosporus]